jgi:asparagine synthase (glutamine-hydrolysing)
MTFWVRIEIAPEGLAPIDPTDRAPGFATRTARVWSGSPPILLRDRGCIAGYLFRREIPSGRVLDLDEAAIGKAIATRGESLLADFWGGYVALIESDDGSIDVIRDPSGMLPCYVRPSGPFVRLASDMTDLVAPGTAAIDFEVITRMFASVDALGRKTAVAGVEELLPGERLRVTSAGTHTSLAWSPWDYIPSRYRRSFVDDVDAVRTTVKDCVGSWTTCFDSILLGVSGGVDSSIVAAAAIPRTPGLRLLTFVEPGTEGDERRYAAALAAKLGIPLSASHFDLGMVDVTKPTLPHFPVPIALPIFQAIEAIHMDEDRFKPIDAFFSGNGGDNVFCNMRSAAPLADRLIARGPTPGLWRTAQDLADLTGSPIAQVIRHGWRRFRDRCEPHSVRFDLMGLTPRAATDAIAGEDRHPWLTAPSGALPGQKAYVAMQARGQKSVELYPRRKTAPQIAPLLSQPIAELCLSIPTWHSVRGGHNRAVARAAFASDLPPLIADRRTKGSPHGFLRRIFDAQLSGGLTLLRGGRLVEVGIVDPHFLARAHEGAWRDDGRDLRILTFCAAEAWVRWWEKGGAPSNNTAAGKAC